MQECAGPCAAPGCGEEGLEVFGGVQIVPERRDGQLARFHTRSFCVRDMALGAVGSETGGNYVAGSAKQLRRSTRRPRRERPAGPPVRPPLRASPKGFLKGFRRRREIDANIEEHRDKIMTCLEGLSFDVPPPETLKVGRVHVGDADGTPIGADLEHLENLRISKN